jgi:hypothetical protein
MDGLAVALAKQNKLNEAEDMQRKCLEIRLRIFQTDHPFIADTIHKLALILEKQNKLSEAEELQIKYLEIR